MYIHVCIYIYIYIFILMSRSAVGAWIDVCMSTWMYNVWTLLPSSSIYVCLGWPILRSISNPLITYYGCVVSIGFMIYIYTHKQTHRCVHIYIYIYDHNNNNHHYYHHSHNAVMLTMTILTTCISIVLHSLCL